MIHVWLLIVIYSNAPIYQAAYLSKADCEARLAQARTTLVPGEIAACTPGFLYEAGPK